MEALMEPPTMGVAGAPLCILCGSGLGTADALVLPCGRGQMEKKGGTRHRVGAGCGG